MITTLSVEIVQPENGLRKVFNRLRRDRVEVEIKRYRTLCVKQIKYTSRNGRVRLDKLDKFVGAQRTQVLCGDSIEFPMNSGYRRFNSTMFSARLCTNMAISVLDEFKDSYRLKVGIYDTSAVACECLLSMLEYCSDVVAVTQNSKPYFYITDRALDELGATAVVTKNVGELSDCDLVIAPTTVDEEFELKQGAVMLTVAKPRVHICGEVYYDYNFRLPNGFADLKPEDLGEEYFCSALYTLGSQYQLGSIVPLSCSNENNSQTVSSICSALGAQFETKTIA